VDDPTRSQWGCCTVTFPARPSGGDTKIIVIANSQPHPSALGTALDWPEAKKHAQKVREWGIKVPYHTPSLGNP